MNVYLVHMPAKLHTCLTHNATSNSAFRCKQNVTAMQLQKQAALSDTIQAVAVRTLRCTRRPFQNPIAHLFISPVLFGRWPRCALSQPATELSPLPDDVMNHWPHAAMKVFEARQSCIMENNRPTHCIHTRRPLHQIDSEWAKLAINFGHGVINASKGEGNRQTNSSIALAGLMIFCWARKRGWDRAWYEEF